MAGLQLLAALKGRRRGPAADYEWGSSKILQNHDIDSLARASLRKHLEARDLDVVGTKGEMVLRLKADLEGERLQSLAYSEQIESEFTITKDVEERGCVYGVGANHAGQLAQGDTEPRRVFASISRTRGIGVVSVSTNGDSLCFAVTADHEVLVWGGGGTGADASGKQGRDEDGFVEPSFIHSLNGEEAIRVSAGAAHACAVTRGGDVFSWGHNLCGQLGLSDSKKRPLPELLTFFEQAQDAAVAFVSCGEAHTAALTRAGVVFCWGHGDAGRLGLGGVERLGASPAEKHYFPAPTMVSKLSGIVVRQISCGALHTLALGPNNVFAWGHGAGGRLGLGDCRNRLEPTSIPVLENRCVLNISAATWTSGCVVLAPPLISTGAAYTWGSGYCGQLGLGAAQVQLVPAPVQALIDRCLSVTQLVLGSHHSAVIAMDGEVYTWGSNLHGCLGRSIRERYVEFTPDPGHVSGFGALVERVGRGMVTSIALGREFTLCATKPYEGPSEDVARKLTVEEAIRLDEVAFDEEERRRPPEAEPQAAETAAMDSHRRVGALLDKNMKSTKTQF